MSCCYYNISLVYKDEENHDQALIYKMKDLEISTVLYGMVHPNIAQAYYGIGIVYYEKGLYDKALEQYLQALNIYKKVFGEEDTDIAFVCVNMENVYGAQRKRKLELKYYEMAYTIRKKYLGEDHVLTIQTKRNIKRLKSKMSFHLEMPIPFKIIRSFIIIDTTYSSKFDTHLSFIDTNLNG
jgi:tetratricopeptide (TPR) repeat protein